MKIYPLSRKNNLVIQEIGGEIIIYDLKINKAVCLNETSAMVWQLCDGKKSTAEISLIITKDLGLKVNEDLVWFALEQLKKHELVENYNEIFSPFFNLSRRQIIKKVGLGTMIALPFISSIVAPEGIYAGSCVPFKSTVCTTPANCCPNTPNPPLNCNSNRCCLGTGGLADNAEIPGTTCDIFLAAGE
ncbi:MAG TPA: PqqD family protein [Pyrinomonadaceae bacterium]|nr:PqqD family protein [Pyrinomonadaceae bacterium]